MANKKDAAEEKGPVFEELILDMISQKDEKGLKEGKERRAKKKNGSGTVLQRFMGQHERQEKGRGKKETKSIDVELGHTKSSTVHTVAEWRGGMKAEIE